MPTFIDWVCDKKPGSEKELNGQFDTRYGLVNDVRVFKIEFFGNRHAIPGEDLWHATVLEPYYIDHISQTCRGSYADCVGWCFDRMSNLAVRNDHHPDDPPGPGAAQTGT